MKIILLLTQDEKKNMKNEKWKSSSHCSFSLLLIISILLELYEKKSLTHVKDEKLQKIFLISKYYYIYLCLINLIIFYKNEEQK